MITKEKIMTVLKDQMARLAVKQPAVIREQTLRCGDMQPKRNYALILTGIRRCGKSTLQRQYYYSLNPGFPGKSASLYLNFEDPRLFDFSVDDFVLLDELIHSSGYTSLFFDEIQVVDGWELYIRQKLDEHYTVLVTGSNAGMLGSELGTKLTGRHLDRELLPFSYTEYLTFRGFLEKSAAFPADAPSFLSYLAQGGFPEYLELNDEEILFRLFDDILYRDIAVRYGIRDTSALKRLALFLLSNTGNPVTANRLTGAMGIKSASTVLDYFSCLEHSYLLSFVQKFDWSFRTQNVNPRKIYACDTGLARVLSVTPSADTGHLLETAVYWQLHRRYRNVWYYSETDSECDFLCGQKNTPETAVQVCSTITHENRQRETDGLKRAMEKFSIPEGYVITLDQKDAYIQNGKEIYILPAYEWMAGKTTP